MERGTEPEMGRITKDRKVDEKTKEDYQGILKLKTGWTFGGCECGDCTR
jgi:hypothetical protein